MFCCKLLSYSPPLPPVRVSSNHVSRPISYANGLKISFANCIYGLAHELDPSIDAQKVRTTREACGGGGGGEGPHLTRIYLVT